MLTGTFLSDHPALKSRWGDAKSRRGDANSRWEGRVPLRLPYNLSTACRDSHVSQCDNEQILKRPLLNLHYPIEYTYLAKTAKQKTSELLSDRRCWIVSIKELWKEPNLTDRLRSQALCDWVNI